MRRFVLINENGSEGVGFVSLNSITGRKIGSRSACYKLKKKIEHKFPECNYVIHELVKIGK